MFKIRVVDILQQNNEKDNDTESLEEEHTCQSDKIATTITKSGTDKKDDPWLKLDHVVFHL